MEKTMNNKEFLEFLGFAVAVENSWFGGSSIGNRYCEIQEKEKCKKMVNDLFRRERNIED